MNVGDTIITITGSSIWWAGAEKACEEARRLGHTIEHVSTWTARDELRLHTAIDARDVCRACLASVGQAAEARRAACRGGRKAKRRAVRKAVELALSEAA